MREAIGPPLPEPINPSPRDVLSIVIDAKFTRYPNCAIPEVTSDGHAYQSVTLLNSIKLSREVLGDGVYGNTHITYIPLVDRPPYVKPRSEVVQHALLLTEDGTLWHEHRVDESASTFTPLSGIRRGILLARILRSRPWGAYPKFGRQSPTP